MARLVGEILVAHRFRYTRACQVGREPTTMTVGFRSSRTLESRLLVTRILPFHIAVDIGVRSEIVWVLGRRETRLQTDALQESTLHFLESAI